MLGDMNFRIDLSYDQVEEMIKKKIQPVLRSKR